MHWLGKYIGVQLQGNILWSSKPSTGFQREFLVLKASTLSLTLSRPGFFGCSVNWFHPPRISAAERHWYHICDNYGTYRGKHMYESEILILRVRKRFSNYAKVNCVLHRFIFLIVQSKLRGWKSYGIFPARNTNELQDFISEQKFMLIFSCIVFWTFLMISLFLQLMYKLGFI